jgi:hypothetical protein
MNAAPRCDTGRPGARRTAARSDARLQPDEAPHQAAEVLASDLGPGTFNTVGKWSHVAACHRASLWLRLCCGASRRRPTRHTAPLAGVALCGGLNAPSLTSADRGRTTAARGQTAELAASTGPVPAPPRDPRLSRSCSASAAIYASRPAWSRSSILGISRSQQTSQAKGRRTAVRRLNANAAGRVSATTAITTTDAPTVYFVPGYRQKDRPGRAGPRFLSDHVRDFGHDASESSEARSLANARPERSVRWRPELTPTSGDRAANCHSRRTRRGSRAAPRGVRARPRLCRPCARTARWPPRFVPRLRRGGRRARARRPGRSVRRPGA